MSKTRLLLVDDDRQVLESMDDWLSDRDTWLKHAVTMTRPWWQSSEVAFTCY